MKHVLCYGDSNTWGYVPETGERYPHDVRWTGVAQAYLGDRYRVIEEALNGRTTVWEDPFRHGRNGRILLGPILESHAPLDLVVLMLGTNDLKHYHGTTAADAARGMGVLVDITLASATGRDGVSPPALVVAPPRITVEVVTMIRPYQGAREKSVDFAHYYADVARERGCEFMDAGELVGPSDEDGVHLDEDAHRTLGEAIAARIREMV